MRRRGAVAAILCGAALCRGAGVAAQAADPPHLGQFPPVERVKEAMRVADPRESALRQLGALWQLQEILKALSGRREFRGFTPGEGRLIGEYSMAHYYIAQAIDSAFPGPYGRWQKVSHNTPYNYSRNDPRFGVEGIDIWKLLPAEVQDQFYQVIGAEKMRVAARARADSEEMRRARSQQAEAQRGGAGLGEDQRRIRRCVESGRSELQCVMEGFGKGLMDLAGAALPGLPLKREPTRGLRMGGVYPGAGGFGLTFYAENVTLSCGDLVPEGHEYAIGFASGGLQIRIATAPSPIILQVRSDGRLAGPGLTEIAGQVQVGVQEGIRTWEDGRTEPISRPVYAPATRRCTIGLLAASGPSPRLGSGSAAAATVLNLALGSPDPEAGKPTPAGLRMGGEYGSEAAFALDFRPEGVVVGCREATVLRPYAVQVRGAEAAITVQNGAAPFSVALGADGSLRGSGMVRVDGRAVTGTGPDGRLSYAPRSETCPLGVLPPAAAQLSEAEQGAAAARASLGPPAAGAGAGAPPTGALGPAAAALTASSAGQGAVIQVENGLPPAPGGVNPLAGQLLMLLDAPFERIAREAGIATAAGGSPAGVLERSCTSVAREAECAKLLQALTAHQVATLRPDAGGTAQSPEIPAGHTYYLFGVVLSAGKRYAWHLPLAVRPGWTRVILGTGNAAP